MVKWCSVTTLACFWLRPFGYTASLAACRQLHGHLPECLTHIAKLFRLLSACECVSSFFEPMSFAKYRAQQLDTNQLHRHPPYCAGCQIVDRCTQSPWEEGSISFPHFVSFSGTLYKNGVLLHACFQVFFWYLLGPNLDVLDSKTKHLAAEKAKNDFHRSWHFHDVRIRFS